MYPKLGTLFKDYQAFQKVKAESTDKTGSDILIKFQQDLLMACGQIHWLCLDQWNVGGKEEYKKFITKTLPGVMYDEWRKSRAVTCAHLRNMYEILNVGLKPEHIVGETFYAGIPPVTALEIEAARINTPKSEEYQWIACSEKIGIDGKYHPVDEYGDFKNTSSYDPDDIYEDGSCVTSEKLKKYNKEHEEEQP
jgi:hypothetical protein